ncbi:dockerin type I domain-containing protein [Ruminococcus sp.]|uniref:dockerin type I domain-containing protein n=1 Tax=Ruminococcus sp. TaxID=41978 RepID=UPI0025E9AE86|nr:dockerin type I domain-containing protein [Ruminococcus sp.]
MKNMKKIAAILAAAITVSAMPLSASALEATDEAPYTAWLCLQAGGDMKWVSESEDAALVEEKNNISGTEASITGDGEYSVDVTMEGGSSSIECLILSTNINAYAFVEEGKDPWTDGTAKIEITSVVVERVDGTTTEIEYNGPSEGAFSKENDGVSLRMNLYNTWGNNITDITNEPEGGLNGGDKLVVNFTVSGLVKAEQPEASYGDVDRNSKIDADDAYQVLKEYAATSVGGKSTLDDTQKKNADVSGDGTINADDAYLILVYYAQKSVGGTPTPFPVTQA